MNSNITMPEFLKDSIEEWIDSEVEEEIRDYTIRVRIDNRLVVIDSVSFVGGEIEIKISSPLYFPDTDDLAAVELLPKEGAV